MKDSQEKPLLQVNDEPMVRLVIEALKGASLVDRIVIAVTDITRNTKDTVRELGAEVIETSGEGYEQDMQQAIRTLGLKDVVVVAADLPFLASRTVDDAIRGYFSAGKPALTVAAPVELYEKSGLEASYTFDYEGRKLVPVGLNVINGTRINEGRLDETVLVVEDRDLIFNVNTQADLKMARSYREQSRREDHRKLDGA